MSNMTLFEGNPLASSDLFKSLQEMNDNLSGGSGGGLPRLSFRGGKFREIVNGEQVNVRKEDWLNVVVVNAAKISRTYYEGTYDAENPAAPTCWSVDTQTPAPEVPEDQRQAPRCMDCPQNIKGSGQGQGRACRFAQRVAVVLEGQLDKVYQAQFSAMSIFGEAKDGKMPMQAYARLLKNHNTPAIAVITQMYFDENSDVPKLFFKPVRPLDEEELQQVVAIKDSEEAIKAITMTVAQTDGVQQGSTEPEKPARKPASKAAKAKPKVEEVEAEAEEIEEPKKVSAKKEKPEPADDDLQSIVDAWDD